MNNLRFLSPALASWVRALPSTGLFESLGEGRFRLRVSQAQLAETLGYTSGAGALSRRLKRLEQAGVVLTRRPLVIVLPDEDDGLTRASPGVDTASKVPDPRPRSSTRSATPGGSVDGSVDGALWDLLQYCLAERLELLGARVLDLLFLDRPGGAPQQESPSATARAARGASSTGPVFTRRARGFEYENPRRSRDLRNSVQTDVYLSDAPRAARAERAGRSLGELQPLLTPLHTECAGRGLPGATNMPGLLAALERLDDDEVARGVSFVVHQIRSGVDVRSPFGLLAALAARGSLSDVAR